MIIEQNHSTNLYFLGLNINLYQTSEYEVYLSPQPNIKGNLIVFNIKQALQSLGKDSSFESCQNIYEQLSIQLNKINPDYREELTYPDWVISFPNPVFPYSLLNSISLFYVN
ncbi:hypothetical protein [Cyanothece sp. BG0011]|uniref:hypothetical protein n=1 Tax=Cyanothece sp. BG0011 TaxID=2082950 RepID=UPI000D1E1B6B|nr:hypothetical protein [Cyanothece sp. BG0011]